MTAALVAQKLMAHLQVDPKCLAQIINIMKNVSENGVPAVEIARVFNDGIMPPEMVEHLATLALEAVAQDITPVDVDAHVQLYDNLRLKSNIPLEVIEFVENKLVQVIYMIYCTVLFDKGAISSSLPSPLDSPNF